MRILFVVSYFYPAMAYGGPAKVAYELAKELSKKNEVTVYTSDVWDNKRRITSMEKLKDENGLKVIYFSNLVNRLAFRSRFFTCFGMVWHFLLYNKSYDFIHIHDVFILPQIFLGYLAIFFNKPYVVSPHGVLDPLRTKRRSLLKKATLLLANPVLYRAKTLISTSHEETKVLKSLGYPKVKTVFNGIDPKLEKPSSNFKKFDNRKFTLLFIGKIHPLKGLKELLAALTDLKFDFQVLIAGPDDGGKIELLKKATKKVLQRVHFLGFVDENEKSELYKLSDVFSHPSLSEGFSISILEAIKYGLPVLITQACNFPDIKKYQAGLVVDEKNIVHELVEAIKYLKNNPTRLKQMGKNGRMLLVRKYSIGAMAESLQSIYEHNV